jgi:hypothetical protein
LAAAGGRQAGLDGARVLHPSAEECRCLCGSLLARVVGSHVELKCRRCKRTLLVPLPSPPAAAALRGARSLPIHEVG